MADGDVDGRRVWHRIGDAIDELRRTALQQPKVIEASRRNYPHQPLALISKIHPNPLLARLRLRLVHGRVRHRRSEEAKALLDELS